MKYFNSRCLAALFAGSLFYGYSAQSLASAFQIFEQDAAGVGTYHAGYAASANDASTAFFNPAGLVRLKNQQFVTGVDFINTDFTYTGDVSVSEYLPPPTDVHTMDHFNVRAQGGSFNFIPFLHYAAPINDNLSFGFSVDIPFGLKSDYGRTSALQYAATLSSIRIINISPSLGFRLTPKFSLGAGWDIQRGSAEFDSVGHLNGTTIFDSTSINRMNDTAYGYHLGALFEYSDFTRVGISYHSHAVHHFKGTSRLTGVLAGGGADPDAKSFAYRNANTTITLPAYTAFSIYHELNQRLSLMATAIYTEWSTFKSLRLKNIAAIGDNGLAPLTITIPQHFTDTWNYTVGGNYIVNDFLTLRAGLGYDQTPVRRRYRTVQLPDNDRYLASLGSHLQLSKTVGLDIGWTHVLTSNATIHPPEQAMGVQVVTTKGRARGGADVFGAQIVWDIT